MVEMRTSRENSKNDFSMRLQQRARPPAGWKMYTCRWPLGFTKHQTYAFFWRTYLALNIGHDELQQHGIRHDAKRHDHDNDPPRAEHTYQAQQMVHTMCPLTGDRTQHHIVMRAPTLQRAALTDKVALELHAYQMDGTTSTL